ncbi:MAG TPA: hypothetical protein VGV38_04520, partial [Pyrinomonadaceae bacterium]|nr:hypothetical protein [Pyrinomonadaceae bacterium]
LWTDAGGIVLLPDDGRAHLSENLRPGQEAEVTIVVHTPAEPGEYLLQLDLVQEGVAWFRQQGSAPARVRVTVKDDGRPRADAREARLSNFDVPEMELYGTSKAEVLRWVKRGGGRVVDVQEDTAAQDWRGFRYCVTRTRSAPTTK